MLDNEAFVFDCVCHVFNFDKRNAFGKPGQMFIDHLYAFHQVLTPPGERVLGPEEFLREWNIDEIARMVFEESGTDMIVAQPLPLTDLFYDGLSQWEKCAAMAQKYPDRAIFWGTINPLEGKKALDLMERQVKEYGAKAFKLYNVRYDYGQPFPWRMDDPRVAFPVFEKALELGVTTIGVHKGVPLGPQPIEHTQAWDMDGAAANFPDLNFIIFHVRVPRVFAENMGKLMFWCGEDKILYGGETPIWHPRWALDAFWNFELPEDLVTGYGYPQLTKQARKKILGGNLARLMGIDVEQKVAQLKG